MHRSLEDKRLSCPIPHTIPLVCAIFDWKRAPEFVHVVCLPTPRLPRAHIQVTVWRGQQSVLSWYSMTCVFVCNAEPPAPPPHMPCYINKSLKCIAFIQLATSPPLRHPPPRHYRMSPETTTVYERTLIIVPDFAKTAIGPHSNWPPHQDTLILSCSDGINSRQVTSLHLRISLSLSLLASHLAN